MSIDPQSMQYDSAKPIRLAIDPSASRQLGGRLAEAILGWQNREISRRAWIASAKWPRDDIAWRVSLRAGWYEIHIGSMREQS